MTLLSILALTLIGCGDKDGDDTATDGGTGDGGGTGVDISAYINVTDAHQGDIDSCCELGGSGATSDCWDGSSWIVQAIDSTKQVDAALVGNVADFESGDPVADATLSLWFLNDPTVGAPDYSVVGDADGIVASTFKTCTPIAYKTSTDPALDATVDTYEINQIEAYTEGTIDTEFNSVSSTTYAIIPSLLGVSPDGDKGTIAGAAYDCGGAPIKGAQVVVRDPSTGEIPESLVVKYFVDSFPNRNQPYTSEDGLWVAINVPEGTWDVELYVADGDGGHTNIGKTIAYIFPGSIMISNVYTGFGDGKRYPDICLL